VNLQLDHFSIIQKYLATKTFWCAFKPRAKNPKKLFTSEGVCVCAQATEEESVFTFTASSFLKTLPLEIKKKLFGFSFCFQPRLPQRVAMDDLASYFVEERSKVR
jgi:hypothetical protein